MVIHSYFTDGFYKFGINLIRSLKNIHGEKYPVVLTTRNLNLDQINLLNAIYKNLRVFNEALDIDYFVEKTGVRKEEALKYKYEIEKLNVNKSNRTNVLWKQFISVEDRYKKSIMEVWEFTDQKHILHLDADSYIRKPLDPLFDIIKRNDVSLIFTNDNRPHRKIFGSTIGLKKGKNALKFMNAWIKEIDKIPLKNKPLGYGQTSCLAAYNITKNQIKFGRFNPIWVKPNLDERAIIWAGNHPRGKEKTANLFEDFVKEKV